MFLSNHVEGGHSFFNFIKGGYLQKNLENPGSNIIQQNDNHDNTFRPRRIAFIHNHCKFNFFRLKRYALYCYIIKLF